MAATMKDVAALAGLSIGTVSNYITGRVAVSEEKKHRIEQAIEKLNYQINPAARTLKTISTTSSVSLSRIFETCSWYV